ncbi:uncharacterized protein LOC112128226 isoform X3 [Cimex lectularius]|uniref:Uncharacterized protein n=1 Tax=Cimex lectularius TaxID=79782 RepID=A0A8I6SPA6_CIMLE|nr:uncharacterized protein LOC112128226 isoform X3 [Cimex lectularius]
MYWLDFSPPQADITSLAAGKVKSLAEMKTGRCKGTCSKKADMEKTWEMLSNRDSFLKVLDDVDEVESCNKQIGLQLITRKSTLGKLSNLFSLHFSKKDRVTFDACALFKVDYPLLHASG